MTSKNELKIEPAKDLTVELERAVPEEETGTKRPEPILSCTMANDIWECPRGTFIMTGRTGTGHYEFGGQKYNTTWTFADCSPVGSHVGWTYKEDGYIFYMFFAKKPSANGKFAVMWSGDNKQFRGYCWAD